MQESLGRLKSDGYLIAVDGFSGDPACIPLYELADILTIEVLQNRKESLAASLASTRPYPASRLAMHVPDQSQFKLCQELGFSLFQGPFFKSPDQITLRKLSSNE